MDDCNASPPSYHYSHPQQDPPMVPCVHAWRSKSRTPGFVGRLGGVTRHYSGRAPRVLRLIGGGVLGYPLNASPSFSMPCARPILKAGVFQHHILCGVHFFKRGVQGCFDTAFVCVRAPKSAVSRRVAARSPFLGELSCALPARRVRSAEHDRGAAVRPRAVVLARRGALAQLAWSEFSCDACSEQKGSHQSNRAVLPCHVQLSHTQRLDLPASAASPLAKGALTPEWEARNPA